MKGKYMSTEEFEAIKRRAIRKNNKDALKLIEQIETMAQGAAAVKRAAQKEQALRQRYYAALLKARGALGVNVKKLKKHELANLAVMVRDDVVEALSN